MKEFLSKISSAHLNYAHRTHVGLRGLQLMGVLTDSPCTQCMECPTVASFRRSVSLQLLGIFSFSLHICITIPLVSDEMKPLHRRPVHLRSRCSEVADWAMVDLAVCGWREWLSMQSRDEKTIEYFHWSTLSSQRAVTSMSGGTNCRGCTRSQRYAGADEFDWQEGIIR